MCRKENGMIKHGLLLAGLVSILMVPALPAVAADTCRLDEWKTGCIGEC